MVQQLRRGRSRANIDDGELYMKTMFYGIAAIVLAAFVTGCGANPAWDNTQATMDPHDKYAAEMKAKQDAAPPIPDSPKAPVAQAPAAKAQ